MQYTSTKGAVVTVAGLSIATGWTAISTWQGETEALAFRVSLTQGGANGIELRITTEGDAADGWTTFVPVLSERNDDTSPATPAAFVHAVAPGAASTQHLWLHCSRALCATRARLEARALVGAHAGHSITAQPLGGRV